MLVTPGASRVYGTYWQSADAGFCVGARYFRHGQNVTPVIAWLYDVTAVAFFKSAAFFYVKPNIGAVPDDWEHAYFTPRLPIDPTHLYRIDVWIRSAFAYRFPGAVAAAPLVSESLTVLQNSSMVPNGDWATTLAGAPVTSMAGDLAAIDVLFWKPQ